VTINISAYRVIVCIIVAGIATFFWWASLEILHWPAWVAMWIFGFVLLVLSVAITERVVAA
jgi:hypothetical protein